MIMNKGIQSENNLLDISNSVDEVLSHIDIIEFGLKCYNAGLYDAINNPKGGESISEKYLAFLKSINKS